MINSLDLSTTPGAEIAGSKMDVGAAESVLGCLLPVPGIKQPAVETLQEAVQKAKQWLDHLQDLRVSSDSSSANINCNYMRIYS